MTSDRPETKALEEAYVWIWLPGATVPIVAGRIARDGKRLIFNYGQSYPDFRDSDADSINFAGSRRKSCLFSMPGSPETVVVPT